jgi:hypothetical protein
LVHEVCNGIFYPISFGFQFYLAQYITRKNDVVVTSHQVPLEISEQVRLDLFEMVNNENKIGLF